MTPKSSLGAVQAITQLRATVVAFPGRGFAVVDGAHYEDLTARFRRERLFARSLFLDQADAEIQEAGPWLVGLDQAPDAIDRVLTLVGEKPAAVFWSCKLGEAVLYRHLRTINTARIPDWAAQGSAFPDGVRSLDNYDRVYFRHFDPRVLGVLLPCLDTDQFSRFLGPAEEVAFVCKDFGLKRAVRDGANSPVNCGALTVRSEQIRAMIQRRVSVSRSRIVDFLRKAAAHETSALDDHQLLELVVSSEQSGRRLGLASEQGLGRWAFIIAKTNGDARYQNKLLAFQAGDRRDAEERVKCLVDCIEQEDI